LERRSRWTRKVKVTECGLTGTTHLSRTALPGITRNNLTIGSYLEEVTFHNMLILVVLILGDTFLGTPKPSPYFRSPLFRLSKIDEILKVMNNLILPKLKKL
jgi:hypothetical protein